MPNKQRRLWKEKFRTPNTPFTVWPSVDKLIKSRLTAHAKAKDKSLAKHQALMLNAVVPISIILEEAAKGMLSVKTATEAAQTALKFLGNASMQMNRERRRIAIEVMNPSLTDLAEDNKAFGKAAPLLFGEGFAKKAKERDEELKCLNQASKQPSASQITFKPGQNSQFFRGSRPQTYTHRGGGHFKPRETREQTPPTPKATKLNPKDPTAIMSILHIAKTMILIAGTDLPIVNNILIQKNYLSNLIQLPIVHALVSIRNK